MVLLGQASSIKEVADDAVTRLRRGPRLVGSPCWYRESRMYR